MGIINEVLPGAQVRPNPSPNIAEPELQLVPNDRRITAAGLDRAALANIVRAVTSGAYVGEYFDGNDRMDMILRGPVWNSPEELASTPIATPLAPPAPRQSRWKRWGVGVGLLALAAAALAFVGPL